MRKALATFAAGGYADLLAIARPTFEAYAERHGYEYREGLAGPIDHGRPPSWWRIPTLQALLADYDAVLWLGCDIVIVDGRTDLADEVPADAWQAMVAHHTPEGEIPNCDVWWVTQAMLPYLAQAWDMTQYTKHCWWEQAAILDLMGYDPNVRPLRQERDSDLYDRTHFLPLEWNSHESADRAENPKFAHATHGSTPWRRAVMQRYAAQVEWIDESD